MRLLLISSRFPDSFWSSKWARTEILPNQRAIIPPLGLATLATLCPSDWEVEVVDENIEPIPLDPQADIVGVLSMGVQFPRQQELLAYYRERGAVGACRSRTLERGAGRCAPGAGNSGRKRIPREARDAS